MRKSILYVAVLCAFMPFAAISSFAQTTLSETDPMAYAKSLHKVKSSGVTTLRQNKSLNSTDYFTHNYGSETVIPRKIIADLTAKYGPPKTGRGDLKVWEVKNRKGRDVTIMLGSNKAGQQEFIIDQRSPARRTVAPKAASPKAFTAPLKSARPKTLPNERD